MLSFSVFPAGDRGCKKHLRSALHLQFDGTALVFGIISHHDAAGIGPRLAAEVLQVLDGQSRFFHHFPVNTLFQCFSRFEKTRHQSVEGAPEVAGMYQQNTVSFFINTMTAGEMRG